MFTAAPELTTGITDFILGLLALSVTIGLGICNRKQKNANVTMAVTIVGILSVASMYGGALHAFAMSRALFKALWIPLGIMLATMPVGVLAIIGNIWLKSGLSKKTTSLLCALIVAVAGVGILINYMIQHAFNFIMFIIFSTTIFFAAFLVCIVVAIRDKRPSSAILAVGIAIMIAASITQQALCNQGFYFILKYVFDFNTVYHITMMFAVTFGAIGVRLFLKEEDTKKTNLMTASVIATCSQEN